jgi:hypothetical protein
VRENDLIEAKLALGYSVKYNFYDIFQPITQRTNRPGVTIRIRKDRPAESKKSGIYVWYHPQFGYFYVGIAAANNFTERWYKHIQKLLDQCTSAKQMTNWKAFSDRFTSAGYGLDDLKDITLRFFPIADAAEYPDKIQFKKELERLETRIISMINPACNSQHKPDLPSATRYPESTV